MKNLSLLIVTSLGLTACGGGSDSTTETAGITNTYSETVGFVEQVDHTAGTLKVNGTTYKTNNAVVEYDDQPMDIFVIETGMKIDADITNDTINEIELEPSISGPVSAIADNKITVNGITVSYDNLNSEIAVDDWVLVSTQAEVQQQSSVTSIAKVPTLVSAEVEGIITELNTSNFTFKVMDLLIDYRIAKVDDDRPLANGLLVEVEGQYLGSTFVAYDVDSHDNNNYTDKEVVGLITWVSDAGDKFEINNHLLIQVTNTTRYDDGTAVNLVAGRKVSVDVITQGSDLIATEVDFEDQNSSPIITTSVEFNLEGIATTHNDIITINGYDFVTNASTEFDNDVTLASINGERVEIEGVMVNGQYLVKEVDLELADTDISLEGPIENNAIWGYSPADQSLAQFNGMWVEVECQLTNDTISMCTLDD